MRRNEIISLLKNLDLKENIIKHVIAVEKLSLEIANLIINNNPRIKIDLKLISDGALLHDIGRTVTHSINHAVEGVKIAKEYSFSYKILSIIENHIGAGISKEEAEDLGLPVKDYFPKTIEEKIVANADNLLAGYKRVSIERLYNKLLLQKNKAAAKRVLDLNSKISKLAGVKL